MTLAALMVSDISDVFLNTDEHAETVVYTPEGGNARSITAIVDELSAPLINGQSHQERRASLIVRCRDSNTLGIHTIRLGDKLLWNSRTFVNPRVLGRNNGWVAVEFDEPTIETSGRQRRGGL